MSSNALVDTGALRLGREEKGDGLELVREREVALHGFLRPPRLFSVDGWLAGGHRAGNPVLGPEVRCAGRRVGL